MHLTPVHINAAPPSLGTTKEKVHAGAVAASRAHKRCPTALAHSEVALRAVVNIFLQTHKRRRKVDTDTETPQRLLLEASHRVRNHALPQTNGVVGAVDHLHCKVFEELVLVSAADAPRAPAQSNQASKKHMRDSETLAHRDQWWVQSLFSSLK